IRQLLKALAEYEASEFTLDTGEYKLTVKRGAQVVMSEAPMAAAPAPAAAPAAPAPAPAAVQEAAPAEAAPAANSNLIEVLAPIVGTFYAAPSPDAQPFVKVG